jgi:hypothetical protein
MVRGFERDSSGAPPAAPVALGLAPTAPLLRASGTDRAARPAYRLVVEQRLGAVPVAEYGLRFELGPCPGSPGVSEDVVVLGDNAHDDEATLLLDLCRPPACQASNDEVRRGAGEVGVGDARAAPPGLTEIAVFSRGDAMQLAEDPVGFTDFLGDEVRIDLTPDPPAVPVSVRVLIADQLTVAPAEVARAREILDEMGCGLDIDDTVTDLSPVLEGDPVVQSSCNNAAVLRQKAGFDPGKLNVYYVELPTGFRGDWCGSADGGATILIGRTADLETLAHELGHAFSLGHVDNEDYNLDGVDDFDGSNVMWPGGTGRKWLSEGQCFYSNVSEFSAVNFLGVRSGTTRICDEAVPTPKCPWIGLDVLPD